MSVRFTLEKRTNSYGECPIRLSWSFSGLRYQSTLGFSIKKTDWDEMRRLVKHDAHNHNGQTANDINFYIKRISLVVTGIEQQLGAHEKALSKAMMKQALSDALSNEIAHPEDIIERCLNGIVSIPKLTAQYYRDLNGKYYQFLCDTKIEHFHDARYYVLQELFGRRDRIAVPSNKFRPEKVEGSMYKTTYYEEVSYEEVFGR